MTLAWEFTFANKHDSQQFLFKHFPTFFVTANTLLTMQEVNVNLTIIWLTFFALLYKILPEYIN